MKQFIIKSLVLYVILALIMSCSDDDEPTNMAPVLTNVTFIIEEDATVGTLVGAVDASDADGDELTYSILSGNLDNTFAIDSFSGEITVVGMLNFDSISTYILEINVTDGISNTTAEITISVTEVIETGLFDETITYDGLQREYLLYIPENFTGSEPVPILFSLHGAGGTKESQYELSQFNVLADSENFILITPEATGINGGNLTFWNQQSDPGRADDVGFIDALIDEIDNRYNIDLDRIYIAGSSNGAFMTLEIACQLNDRIAAAAAVKGYMSSDQISNCNPTHPTPIIQMHGTTDPLVPYSGLDPTIQFWTTFNQTDANPLVTTLPDIDSNNGNTVNRYLYANGTNGVEIEHLEVINGGHDWFGEPGTNYDINASIEAWLFFERFDINGLR